MSSNKGADHARNVLVNEIEEAELRFLPRDMTLAPNRSGTNQLVVQPDALITSPGSFVLVEAKRVRSSSFQPEQLAKEYVATMAHVATRTPRASRKPISGQPSVLSQGNTPPGAGGRPAGTCWPSPSGTAWC